jgi:crossover junction endodeoxyribonuclease RusA
MPASTLPDLVHRPAHMAVDKPFLTMSLPGDPMAKARPRVTKTGHAYTPEHTRAAERAIVAQAQMAMDGDAPLDRPVGIAVDFYCATKRRTDGDNMLKLVTDALNGVVYEDDSLILEYVCRVYRGVGKANAHAEVKVYILEPTLAGAPVAPTLANQ